MSEMLLIQCTISACSQGFREPPWWRTLWNLIESLAFHFDHKISEHQSKNRSTSSKIELGIFQKDQLSLSFAGNDA